MGPDLFKVGGPLTPEEASLYVVRTADEEARRHLDSMHYLLIIEPRQQGKTSLLARLHTVFNTGETVFGCIDLSDFTHEDERLWFARFWNELSTRCRRVFENSERMSPPSNRTEWGERLRFLARLAEDHSSKLIIALDEVDSMARTPWAEPFFVSIRKFFNERAFETTHKRVAFVLAGAFHPQDLIADETTSPFNIAQRVRLWDFTLTQVRELVSRGNWPESQAAALAERIHHWTGGHPYLSQLMCSFLGSNATPADVDASVERLRRDGDSHMSRLLARLRSDKDLRTYIAEIMAGKSIRFYPVVHRRQGQLELLGVIKANDDGVCELRNRIYKKAIQQIVERKKATEGLDKLKSKHPQGTGCVSNPILLRLQDLSAHIRDDLSLLRDYENKLRYEDDPGKRAYYRKQTEILRESAAAYQTEYDELGIGLAGKTPQKMLDVAGELAEMNKSIKAIQNYLTDVVLDVLAHFDTKGQEIIEAVVKQLKQNELINVQTILDAIENDSLQANQLEHLMCALQGTLASIDKQGTHGHILPNEVMRVSKVVVDPTLDVKHKMKFAVPIIPFILSYEGEVELNSGLSLKGLWEHLISKVRRRSTAID